jgi:hypothetical protein
VAVHARTSLLRFAAQLGSPYVDAAAKSWRYDEDVDLDSDARDAVNRVLSDEIDG